MDKMIEWVLAQYGVSGVILLALTIVIFKFSSPILNTLRSIFWKELNYNNKPSKIIKYKMTYWKDFKIQNICIRDRGRRKILQDFLKLKFNILQENFILPMQELNANSMDASDISNELLHAGAISVELYENEARNAGIPEIVLVEFTKLHRVSLEKFHLNSQMILESAGIYNSNEDKLEAITSLLIVLLELTIVDVERTLSNLNGDLTGFVYQGITCG